jgi:hypothetical protein
MTKPSEIVNVHYVVGAVETAIALNRRKLVSGVGVDWPITSDMMDSTR